MEEEATGFGIDYSEFLRGNARDVKYVLELRATKCWGENNTP